MRKLEYTVSFNTPAFLGNAEQQAQWRTPPFKALIRQWWRVAHAANVNYSVSQLRRDEAKLFGSAANDEGVGSGKSLVRMRLSSWDQGAMKEWQACGSVYHPEVGPQGRPVGADLYLGYGPLGYDKDRGTILKRSAVQPTLASAKLQIAYPAESEFEITRTMQLIAWFGTIGSRSRNGWGSLALEGQNVALCTPAALNSCARRLEDCLHQEWAHAVGLDEKGPTLWTTSLQRDWRKVMQRLAEIKIGIRTEPKLLSLAGKEDGDVAARHLLAYPLTNHAALGPINVKENEAGWVDLDFKTKQPKTDKRGKYIQSVRLANQLRMKVARLSNGNFQGVIVHLPCKVPDELVNKLSQSDQQFIRNNELAVWQAVHKVLDREATRLA